MPDQPQADVVLKGLRKINAALEGTKHPPVVIGDLAYQAWGVPREPQNILLLVPSGEAHRDAIFGAARGEGLQQMPDGHIKTTPEGTTLRLKYTDPKLGGSTTVDLI